MGYIKLPDILQKIIEDPSYESGQFKDIKPIILGMLDTYNYEETLLKTTNHILIHDVQLSLTNLYSLSHRGVVSDNDCCCLCDRPAAIESCTEGISDDVIVFSCSHLYHCSCLGISGSTTLGITCLLCDKTAKPSLTHQSRLTSTPRGEELNKSNRKQTKEDTINLDYYQLRSLKTLNITASISDNVPVMELRLAPPRIEN